MTLLLIDEDGDGECFSDIVTLGRVALPNRMNFQKTAKGGRGGHFQSKIYVADLGTLNKAFEHEIDTK